uniref:Uncharacterized protein n=1 Tax=Mucochytrium quahogii TaxID=96639 RepID=A0A7S2SJS6_9STRA|mmetsp:Transcript_6058/g.13562  ORF Transcript_6058/g.13562 Transcript_6058/m.13562 type:complete len:383 (+) Transcript_6058:73-1221(+)
MYEVGLEFGGNLGFHAIGGEDLRVGSKWSLPGPILLGDCSRTDLNRSGVLSASRKGGLKPAPKPKQPKATAGKSKSGWNDDVHVETLFDPKLEKRLLDRRKEVKTEHSKLTKQAWDSDTKVDNILFGMPKTVRVHKKKSPVQVQKKKRKKKAVLRKRPLSRSKKKDSPRASEPVERVPEKEENFENVVIVRDGPHARKIKMNTVGVNTTVDKQKEHPVIQVSSKGTSTNVGSSPVRQRKKTCKNKSTVEKSVQVDKERENIVRQKGEQLVHLEKSVLRKWSHLKLENIEDLLVQIPEKETPTMRKRDTWTLNQVTLERILENRQEFIHHRSLVEASLAGTGMSQHQIVESLVDILYAQYVSEISTEVASCCDIIGDTIFQSC